eukprot:1147927-Pelagomonas_calceolata.AAC.3
MQQSMVPAGRVKTRRAKREGQPLHPAQSLFYYHQEPFLETHTLLHTCLNTSGKHSTHHHLHSGSATHLGEPALAYTRWLLCMLQPSNNPHTMWMM